MVPLLQMATSISVITPQWSSLLLQNYHNSHPHYHGICTFHFGYRGFPAVTAVLPLFQLPCSYLMLTSIITGTVFQTPEQRVDKLTMNTRRAQMEYAGDAMLLVGHMDEILIAHGISS